MSKATINRIEKGADPGLEVALAQVLDTSLADLLNPGLGVRVSVTDGAAYRAPVLRNWLGHGKSRRGELADDALNTIVRADMAIAEARVAGEH